MKVLAAKIDSIKNTKTLDTDPFLKYSTALALFQEMQFMNTLTKKASLAYDYSPYIVRLQISDTPKKDHLPYDLENFYSFFLEDSGELPIVQPLLVTDNIEYAFRNMHNDELKNFSTSISGYLSSIGLGANFEEYNRNIDKLFARKYNNLMHVAKSSENTVKVRFGANYDPESKYHLMTKNQNVTLLLLIPKSKNNQTNQLYNKHKQVISPFFEVCESFFILLIFVF